MMAYATIAEFRNVTNIQSSEFEDAKITQLLNYGTTMIDESTGRTWQGPITITNAYYDGDGQSYLYLQRYDISSVTALSIDENYDGTYTDVDTDDLLIYSDLGKIVLDSPRNTDIAVSSFRKGLQTVKISYTYGAETVTEDVKELCIMIARNEIENKSDITSKIKTEINKLRANTIDVV
jgi:hypothetical protein